MPLLNFSDALLSQLQPWLLAACVWGIVYLALAITRRKLLACLRASITTQQDVQTHQAGLKSALANALESTQPLFMAAVALWAAGYFLSPASMLMLPKSLFKGLFTTFPFVIFLLQSGLWGNGIVDRLIRSGLLEQNNNPKLMQSMLGPAQFVAKAVLWLTLFVVCLGTLGVNVTALVAGLGIGGVAMALAVQNVLGDLLAAVSIILDRPFGVGDFIVVDDLKGTVEHIGLKTTRVRSLSGELLIFSNADLLKSRIRNFQELLERRVVFMLSVAEQTPLDLLQQVPDTLRRIIEAQPKTRFDRAHFFKFGEASFDFEVAYYVLDSQYNVYMDTQQAINLGIVQAFSQVGIAFAYPTRRVYSVGDATPGFSSNSGV